MSPSYQTNDPKGWCGNPSRGAAMGRASIHADDKNKPVKLYLRRIPLDDGYDTNGTYFGSGAPLYWVADYEGEIDYVLRASDRESAKATIRCFDYPSARFYR